MDYFVHTHSGEEQGSHFTPLALPSALLPMGPPATVKLPDGKFPAKRLNGRLLTERPSNHTAANPASFGRTGFLSGDSRMAGL